MPDTASVQEQLSPGERSRTWRVRFLARERLARVADPGTRTFETGTFVNYGEVFPGDQKSPGAGVVTAFVRIEGRWCMVIANDNTVASGAWWPRTPAP